MNRITTVSCLCCAIAAVAIGVGVWLPPVDATALETGPLAVDGLLDLLHDLVTVLEKIDRALDALNEVLEHFGGEGPGGEPED